MNLAPRLRGRSWLWAPGRVLLGSLAATYLPTLWACPCLRVDDGGPRREDWAICTAPLPRRGRWQGVSCPRCVAVLPWGLGRVERRGRASCPWNGTSRQWILILGSIDCAGILKLRNSDIELRKGETDIGRKNTRVRLVFRVHIPQPSGRTLSLQVASNPIECCEYPVTPTARPHLLYGPSGGSHPLTRFPGLSRRTPLI